MATFQTTARLSRHFEEYAAFHKSRGSHVCHFIGIPCIVWSLFGLLSRIHFTDSVDAGALLFALSMIGYLRMDWKLTLPLGALIFGVYLGARETPTSVSLGLFAMGWVFQALGHQVFEKNRPAFFKNLIHLLVGPLWVFVQCLSAVGIRIQLTRPLTRQP